MKKWIFICLFCCGTVNAATYIDIGCPYTNVDNTSGHHTLSHDGLTVKGYGFESINGVEQEDPYMKGLAPLRVPKDLSEGRYVRAGTSYNAFLGIVKCHYESAADYPNFDVFYSIRNGRNGYVKSSSDAYIRIVLDVGMDEQEEQTS